MRRWMCVPMIALCLLMGCRAEEERDVRRAYREMTGCTMTAVVTCDQDGGVWEAELACDYDPTGETVLEVLDPDTIAGVRATLDGETWQLEYEDVCLNAGAISSQRLSPMTCLPQLMTALREGWLIEENQETWQELPCDRLTLDQTGREGGKVLSTLWIKEDGTPLRGEIAVDGEIILTAVFTEFAFCDTMELPNNP